MKEGRLSCLLENLKERKENRWEAHGKSAEVPTKLKDIRGNQDIHHQQKTKLTPEEA